MSLQHAAHTSPAQQPLPEHQQVGGAIIDDAGREIPITEGMVREACQALEIDRRRDTQPAD